MQFFFIFLQSKVHCNISFLIDQGILFSWLGESFYFLDYFLLSRISKWGDRKKKLKCGWNVTRFTTNHKNKQFFSTLKIWMHFLPLHEVLVVTWIFFVFLIFQNQSVTGNVIQLIKKKSLRNSKCISWLTLFMEPMNCSCWTKVKVTVLQNRYRIHKKRCLFTFAKCE